MANKSSQVAPANAVEKGQCVTVAVGNSGSTGMDPTGAEEEETKKVDPSCFCEEARRLAEASGGKQGCVDIFDAAMYGVVKVIPPTGRFPCCTSKTLSGRRKDIRMTEFIDSLHLGPPLDYDGATNLINTILLVTALFLAFVAASANTPEAENYIAADLSSCKQGWGHEGICIQLDSGGYFGERNATGLLKVGVEYPVKPGDAVNLQGLEFSILPNYINYGKEIPSIAVNYFSAASMAILLVVFIFIILWYMLLVVSGAHSMGEVMMSVFWQTGVVSIIVFLMLLAVAFVLWISSMVRIMQILLPEFPVTGVEFGYFTHSGDITSSGQYFFAWVLEGWGFHVGVVTTVMMAVLAYRVFSTEWNLVKTRPTTPQEFIYYTLARLDKVLGIENIMENSCDCKIRQLTHAITMSRQFPNRKLKDEEIPEGVDSSKLKKGDLSKLHEKLGCDCDNCIVCKEARNILEQFKKYGLKLHPEEETVKTGNIDHFIETMDHFLDIWPHLDWDELRKKEKGKLIKPVYISSLNSMYVELFPDHR